LSVVATTALAQTSQPRPVTDYQNFDSSTHFPASTTAPTSVPADPSTPKGALKALTLALDAGDREKILSLLRAETDSEKKVAAAWANLAEASALLRRAATNAFGAQASRPLSVDPGASAEGLARIDAATVAITGDKASLATPQAEGPPMVLVKHNSGWRVPVTEFSKDIEPSALEQNLRDVSEQSRLMKEVAAEVAAGKYPTALDARKALDQRILHSAMPQLEPTAATTKSAHP
jgi:hypothetical protein